MPDKAGIPQSHYSEKLLVGYRWYDAKHIKPLFPFGFGLSYTTFRLSHLTVTPSRSGPVVHVDVTNTGRRAGADVAQLYLSFPKSAGEPPLQLKGYDKIFLTPGQTRTATMHLNRRSFSIWSTRKHHWIVKPGCYGAHAGDSSASLPLARAIAANGRSCRHR